MSLFQVQLSPLQIICTRGIEGIAKLHECIANFFASIIIITMVTSISKICGIGTHENPINSLVYPMGLLDRTGHWDLEQCYFSKGFMLLV